MSTKLYPFDNIPPPTEEEAKLASIHEQQWLIKEIIIPALPYLIECVTECLAQLKSEETFKTVLSSSSNNHNGNGSSVKGVITRKGDKIVDIYAKVDFGNRKIIELRKTDNREGFILNQIKEIVHQLEDVQGLIEELERCDDIMEFNIKLGISLQILTRCVGLLERPPNDLVYPLCGNSATKALCDFSLLSLNEGEDICLELLLVRNELSLDIRYLSKSTTAPWNKIDINNKQCFADKVKSKLILPGATMISVLKDFNIEIVSDNALGKWNIYRDPEHNTTQAIAQDQLQRGAFYCNNAVLEISKRHASTADPVLVSVSTKLSGLESAVASHVANLAAVTTDDNSIPTNMKMTK